MSATEVHAPEATLVRTKRVGAVAVLTLDDPARRNVLSRRLCEELLAAVEEAEAEASTRLLVITATPPAFCAGADLGDLVAAASGDAAAVELVYKTFLRVADARLPTLAAVNGAAVGAGMNLALSCDMRICAREAIFDTRFLEIGLHPGGGHAWMLLRAVGWQQASRMLLCGSRIDGIEAKAIGLALDCVAADEMMTAALSLGGRLAKLPRELVIRTKATMRLAAAGQDHGRAVAHETTEQAWSLRQPAFADLVDGMKRRMAAKP